ncbi:MAG: hypothetical protein ACREDD_00175 [Methylocella sp.]
MADGDPLKIGNPNTGTSKTSLTANIQDPALFVENNGFGTNSAIWARRVDPQAGGPAIIAEGNTSGLVASATHKDCDAISGVASATSGTATGVQGVTESAAPNFDQNPRVLCGVHGFANTGTGVRGDSVSGFGVSAASPQGIALKVEGKAAFATAGNGAIQAGMSHITVPETHVTSQSHITVTLNGNPGNRAIFCPWRRAAAVDWIERIAGVSFVIHLSKTLANNTPFSYLIVEPI